nr:hypothetical protein [uncultured Sphaerochaeta sp.]
MALLVVAIIGLRQLKISRESLRINATRESLMCANSQIQYYLNEVIKLQNILDAEIKKWSIELYDNAEVIIVGNSITVKLNSDNNELEKIVKICGPMLDVLNAMESFSSFFTSKVADESIAYKAVGNTYCHYVKRIMPSLIALETSGFANIFELFRIWYSRIQKQELQEHKQGIEDKLARIDNVTICPLGTQ